jgi:hypothetical protein
LSLRSIANSNIIIRDFSKLGHCLEGWWPKRLFSVHDLLNEGKYYLKHVLRDRFDYPTLKARAIANAREYRTNRILIEDTGVGTAMIPEAGRILGNCRQAATRQKNAHANPIGKIREWRRVFPAPGVMACGP